MERKLISQAFGIQVVLDRAKPHEKQWDNTPMLVLRRRDNGEIIAVLSEEHIFDENGMRFEMNV